MCHRSFWPLKWFPVTFLLNCSLYCRTESALYCCRRMMKRSLCEGDHFVCFLSYKLCTRACYHKIPQIWKPLDLCTVRKWLQRPAGSCVSLAEPVCVLLCRNWKRRRTRERRSGLSLRGTGRNGKKNESGKESGGIVRGRRNERGSGRGKGSANENETETKIVIAGPEKENATETGRGTEAVKGALTTANPGKRKKTWSGGLIRNTESSNLILLYLDQRLWTSTWL